MIKCPKCGSEYSEEKRATKMKKFFHIDNLEGEVIKNKTFDDHWDNSMVTYGLWLTKEEFELLKSKGHLVFGNNRHENQLLAMTVLAQLLAREGDKAFSTTAEKLLWLWNNVCFERQSFSTIFYTADVTKPDLRLYEDDFSSPDDLIDAAYSWAKEQEK